MNLGIKEYESLDTNPQSRFQDEVDIAINRYKNHPSIKMINENVSFERRFTFKEIYESDIQKEISSLNPKKAGTFGNIQTKVLKESSNVYNAILRDIWHCEILGKQNFFQNLKLANITPVYRKKDPTSVENYWPVSVLPSVSKIFERIIQKQFSSFIDEFLSPYLCGYRKGLTPNTFFFHLLKNGKRVLTTKIIQEQC